MASLDRDEFEARMTRVENLMAEGFRSLHQRHDDMDGRVRSVETKAAVFDDRWLSLRTASAQAGRQSGAWAGGVVAVLTAIGEFLWRRFGGA